MATNKYVLSGSFCGIMNNMEEKKYGLDLASLQCTLGLGSVVEQYTAVIMFDASSPDISQMAAYSGIAIAIRIFMFYDPVHLYSGWKMLWKAKTIGK